MNVLRSPPGSPLQTSAGKRFGRYRKEEKMPARAADVRRDHGFAKVMKAWERFSCILDSEILVDDPYREIEACKHLAMGLAENTGASESSINKFMAAALDSDVNLGIFASALMSSCRRKKITLKLPGNGELLPHLGLWEDKKLVVHGNLGIFTGKWMSAGTMLINGDVLDGLGDEMTGGTIILNGNVVLQYALLPGDVGFDMTGGEIIIRGNIIAHPEYFRRGNRFLHNDEGRIRLEGEIIEREL